MECSEISITSWTISKQSAFLHVICKIYSVYHTWVRRRFDQKIDYLKLLYTPTPGKILADLITASELLTNLCCHHIEPDIPIAPDYQNVLPAVIRWLGFGFGITLFDLNFNLK